jgi:hypothetical protein
LEDLQRLSDGRSPAIAKPKLDLASLAVPVGGEDEPVELRTKPKGDDSSGSMLLIASIVLNVLLLLLLFIAVPLLVAGE